MMLHKHWGRIQKEAAKETGTKVGGHRKIVRNKHKQKLKENEKQMLGDAKDGSTEKGHEIVQSGQNTDVSDENQRETGQKFSVNESSDFVSASVLHVPITKYVTEETDLLQLLRDNIPVITKQGLPVLDDNNMCRSHEESTLSDTYTSLTEKTLSDTSPEDKRLAETSQLKSDTLMLTGLHTCGNLAPSIFRIFLANPSATVMCNVGCCYQHLDEEFWTETGATEGEFFVKYASTEK